LSVREAKGLAYYIHTGTDDYTDSGVLSTNAGVDLNRVDMAVSAIIDEYKKVADEKVPEQELKKSKEFLKGKIILKLEDSEEYAHFLGKYELLYGRARAPEEVLKKIDEVTTDDILRVAKDIFDMKRLKLAAIGPFEGDERFKKLLSF
ncbi:MAG: insulinase family protein, partial [Candidatus Gracilibacteria bacterium]